MLFLAVLWVIGLLQCVTAQTFQISPDGLCSQGSDAIGSTCNVTTEGSLCATVPDSDKQYCCESQHTYCYSWGSTCSGSAPNTTGPGQKFCQYPAGPSPTYTWCCLDEWEDCIDYNSTGDFNLCVARFQNPYATIPAAVANSIASSHLSALSATQVISYTALTLTPVASTTTPSVSSAGTSASQTSPASTSPAATVPPASSQAGNSTGGNAGNGGGGGKKLGGGPIAGITIGTLAGVAGIAAAVWFFFLRKRSNRVYGGGAAGGLTTMVDDGKGRHEMAGTGRIAEMPGEHYAYGPVQGTYEQPYEVGGR